MGRFDEHVATIGHGDAAFVRAREALAHWKHFDVGWVEAFPERSPVQTGTVVAVLIRHLGCWSLNGARVRYQVQGGDDRPAFGFAYGTLVNHAESGEESFEVWLDRPTGDVRYRIRSVSRAQSVFAKAGPPLVRGLQARFRRESALAMMRAVSEGS
jgi:uncharacterized protein (UPF0548 family)